MEEKERSRRPGGRSARVGAAVHQAVTDLVGERGYGGFTVGDVAARAGVADTTVYRRWGSLETLLTDVTLTRLNTRSPMPDTGSVADDLRRYAAQVAREITGPDGLALLQLAVALSARGEEGTRARDGLLAERRRQFESMLDRARARGEHPPAADEFFDHVMAPMYIRVLFGMGPLTEEYVDGLVDRMF
ncbi:TetR/AcrR family transcriptional regulator [Streptomyces sp. VRA16 Mangrove soil]|uniref:TetR/AcrR family transcriptional regulator n=1 Tax=Streptomyces sp. VRA16 Mangrove soil TaxID=2817434 RepID=UPI001A9DEA45|nr:TetR/AcrR family transcriptional regulator [Streptomyces sp. VRA16 Mangrove soil]MBO1335438.1 TetR/AcrR family transcriptional regulator [Streptomyces sp. VRA16 Mangrove soil]